MNFEITIPFWEEFLLITFFVGAIVTTWFIRGIVYRVKEGGLDKLIQETERIQSKVIEDIEQDDCAARIVKNLGIASFALGEAAKDLQKLKVLTQNGVKIKPEYNRVVQQLGKVKSDLISAGRRMDLFFFESPKEENNNKGGGGASDSQKSKAGQELKHACSKAGIGRDKLLAAIKEVDGNIKSFEDFASKDDNKRSQLIASATLKINAAK